MKYLKVKYLTLKEGLSMIKYQFYLSGSFGKIDDLLVIELPSYFGVHDTPLVLVVLQLFVVCPDSCQRLQFWPHIKISKTELNGVSLAPFVRFYLFLKQLDVFAQLPLLHHMRLALSFVLNVAPRLLDEVCLAF